MFWVGFTYTDGSRIAHAFARVVFYKIGGRLHAAGEAICRCTFPEEYSGSRRDIADGVIDADVPEDACTRCRRELGSLN